MMAPNRGAAVTGASGFLGSALVEHLLPGTSVRALFRQPGAQSRALVDRGGGVVLGDLDHDEALQELVRDVDVVYHCAATMAKSDATRSHSVNVLGTERVVRAAAAAGVRRVVYVSSISVYAATRSADDTFTEAMEPERVDRLNNYSRTKHQGELAVRRVGAELGLAYTIIRPTNVYGPRSGPWFHQWVRSLRRCPVALGDLPIDVVYVDDVVEALVSAGRSPMAVNEVFNIGCEMVPMNRFVLEVGRVMGLRVFTLPSSLDRGLRTFIESGYRAVTGSSMSMSLTRRAYYPHTKAKEAFGYHPRVTVPEGFARIAAWYASASAAWPLAERYAR